MADSAQTDVWETTLKKGIEFSDQIRAENQLLRDKFGSSYLFLPSHAPTLLPRRYYKAVKDGRVSHSFNRSQYYFIRDIYRWGPPSAGPVAFQVSQLLWFGISVREPHWTTYFVYPYLPNLVGRIRIFLGSWWRRCEKNCRPMMPSIE